MFAGDLLSLLHKDHCLSAEDHSAFPADLARRGLEADILF